MVGGSGWRAEEAVLLNPFHFSLFVIFFLSALSMSVFQSVCVSLSLSSFEPISLLPLSLILSVCLYAFSLSVELNSL